MTKILDCTLRDGGYQNLWHFKKQSVLDLISSLQKSNVSIVELGFRNGNDVYGVIEYDGKEAGFWRHVTDQNIRNLKAEYKQQTGTDMTVKIALMVDCKVRDISLFSEKKNSDVDLVRIAFYKHEMDDALEFAQKIKDLGYSVSLNAMLTKSYLDEELSQLVKSAESINADYLYIADSFGSMRAKDIHRMVDITNGNRQNVQIGFHAHNNMQNALSNAVLAESKGVHLIDVTAFGMGRGAGNLPIELWLAHNESLNLSILEWSEKYLSASKSVQSFPSWGYHLQFLISAYMNVHPNYVLQLIERNMTSVTQVWNYMKLLVEKNIHLKFDKNAINEIF